MAVTRVECPEGQGTTDRRRCFDLALTRPACWRCPIPVALIAHDGEDAVNRAAAACLSPLLSCPWTPPALQKASRGAIPRAKALSLAIRAYLAKHPHAERLSISRLLPVHNAVPNAVDAPDAKALAALLRRQGLPLEWSKGRPFLKISDHVRAFVRAYVKDKEAV